MADLKLVFAAPTEEAALNELELFRDKAAYLYYKCHRRFQPAASEGNEIQNGIPDG